MATASGEPVIRLSDVTKYFYKRNTRITALSDVSLAIARGEFVSIVGPSGCGKSTILDLVVGFNRPSVGQVSYNGAQPSGVAVGIGYMTQHDTLLAWRTVEQNVRLPLDIKTKGLGRLLGRRRDEASRERVAWAIRLVGLTGFEHHLPGELSGGMRKRAAMAQTLVYARETVLMDEPFGALDFQTRLQMQAELAEIWSRERRTIVFVTHDIEEAIALSDRVIVLTRRPGRVRDILSIDLPRPRDPVTIRFTPHFRELCQRVWKELDPPEGAASPDRPQDAEGGAP